MCYVYLQKLTAIVVVSLHYCHLGRTWSLIVFSIIVVQEEQKLVLPIATVTNMKTTMYVYMIS